MKTTNSNSNSNSKNNSKSLDDIEKQVAKAESLAKIQQNKELRLAKANYILYKLKQGATEDTRGFANITLKQMHQKRAYNITVQGAIDALNTFIKDVANANDLDKKIVATLKGEAAQTILQQVTIETLPLYIDNKGMYKVETLYRLVASKAKNSELRTILNNIKAEK